VNKLSLRARELAWVKIVQRRRRQEKHARGHDAKQKVRIQRRHAETQLAKIRARIKAAKKPLRVRALDVAETLVGVMEQGGNNMGPMVTKIIKANGGTGPEPWCGDTVAYCYRQAGSTMVTRAWASVYFLGQILGLTKTSAPLPGDIVRYTFSHTGLFVKDNGNGTITTIEGNTGPSGAVSDSRTGGDGVYKKIRPKSLVADYRHVTR
jgi:hypothetical protein